MSNQTPEQTRGKGPQVAPILSEIAGSILKHLNPEGIVDQFRNISQEGIYSYLVTRFVQPITRIKESDSILTMQRFDGFDWYKYNVVYGKHLYPELMLQVFDRNTKIEYVVNNDPIIDLEVKFGGEDREGILGYCMPQIYTNEIPPNSAGRISMEGVYQIKDGEVVELYPRKERKMVDTFDSFGALFVGNSGSIKVYDQNEYIRKITKAETDSEIGDGHFIQASWILRGDKPDSWIMLDAKDENSQNNRGIGRYAGIGRMINQDGTYQIITFNSNAFINVSIREVFEIMEYLKEFLGAANWELAGMEAGGGGFFPPVDSDAYQISERSPLSNRIRMNRDDMFVIRKAD